MTKISQLALLDRFISFINNFNPNLPPSTAASQAFDTLLTEKSARLAKKLFPPSPPPNFTCPIKYLGRYRIGDHLVITQETADRHWEEITKRELEVIEAYILAGNLRSASNQLSIAYQTIKKHTGNIHKKLGTSDRQELIRYYLVVNHYPNLDPLFYRPEGSL
jgi:DNA-binding NarL/FixJ family response regulator